MEERRLFPLLGIRGSPVSRPRMAALGLVLITIAVSTPLALARAFSWLWRDVPLLTEPLLEARARTDSPEFTAAVEALRGAISPLDAYCLVDMSRLEGVKHYQLYWVRFNLAPRRMIYLGEFKQGMRALQPPPDAPRELVITAYPDHQPRCVSTRAFFTGVPELRPSREDETITGSLDAPANGESVRGAVLELRGWCEERSGRPCDVRLFIDGEERPARDGITRSPRPGVVPSTGNANTAGFRAQYELSEAEAGEHHVFALFVAEDGRSRSVGPWPFTWSP